MEIKLNQKESEEYFFNALCNEGGTIRSCGCEIDWEERAYVKAKESLKKQNKEICIEDILMEILRMGGKLKMTDIEGDGEYTREITLADVHSRVQKTPIDHLQDMIEENDDATTANVILQTVFLDEVVFG